MGRKRKGVKLHTKKVGDHYEIINIPFHISDCGPFETRAEALEALREIEDELNSRLDFYLELEAKEKEIAKAAREFLSKRSPRQIEK